MILGYVVGYHEEIINGTKYFVGEDGSICRPHPTDPRISRSQLVGHRIF